MADFISLGETKFMMSKLSTNNMYNAFILSLDIIFTLIIFISIFVVTYSIVSYYDAGEITSVAEIYDDLTNNFLIDFSDHIFFASALTLLILLFLHLL